MADWLTAHPQAKYVTGATVYDIRSLGAHAALKAAGFRDNAALVGNGLEPAAKALVDGNDPIMVATLDPGEQNGGKYVIPLALDILAGRPCRRRRTSRSARTAASGAGNSMARIEGMVHVKV